jgi:hypothetical protein
VSGISRFNCSEVLKRLSTLGCGLAIRSHTVDFAVRESRREAQAAAPRGADATCDGGAIGIVVAVSWCPMAKILSDLRIGGETKGDI